jgi:hypothetical protein
MKMQRAKIFKISMFSLLIVLASLASVMYALAYTEKREVVYTNTIKIEGQEVMFRAFYLSAPAAQFEVKLSVSNGTIKDPPLSSDVRGHSWLVSTQSKWDSSRHHSKMGMRDR